MLRAATLLLTSIDPSADGVLLALRPHLTAELILEMAKSDVDIPEEVAANKSALTTIKNSGDVPGCLPWNPAEVCNLLRWDIQPARSVSVMKLFGCWILVRAYVQIESLESGLVDDGDHHTLVAFVEGVLDLGQPFPEPATRFLYWAYLTLLEAGEHRSHARPFYLFALLIAAASSPGLVSNTELFAIDQKLQVEERRVRDSMTNDPHTFYSVDFSVWLFGLVEDDLNNFHSRCYTLIRRLATIPANAQDQERMQLINDMLMRWQAIRPTEVGSI